MENITTQSSIFADINCKGGTALLVGVVVEAREKAVKIDYAIEPIFVGVSANQTFANKTAWVPKSQVVADGRGAFTIKRWFANTAMKGFQIKPYRI